MLLKTQPGTLSKSCQYPCSSLSSIGVLVVISFFCNYQFLCIREFHLPKDSAPQGAALLVQDQGPTAFQQLQFWPGSCVAPQPFLSTGLEGSTVGGWCWLLLSWQFLNQSSVPEPGPKLAVKGCLALGTFANGATWMSKQSLGSRLGISKEGSSGLPLCLTFLNGSGLGSNADGFGKT